MEEGENPRLAVKGPDGLLNSVLENVKRTVEVKAEDERLKGELEEWLVAARLLNSP